MRVLFLIILSLMLNGYSWAYLTAGKIAVTSTSSSSGVPSTSQDSDITDTKGSSVAVGVPVAVTGNVNITGNYQVNGTPISATSNWNQSGSTINYTAGNVSIGSSSPLGLLTVIGGNVGIGSNVPGQVLDVVGTVRATNFTGQSGTGIAKTPTSISVNNIYGPSTSDGFVRIIQSTNGGSAITINGFANTSATPSGGTDLCAQQITGATVESLACSFYVLKGWYYEYTTGGVGTFTPIGS